MKKGILSTYTGKLIIINIVIFIGSMIFLSSYGEGFLDYVALKPVLFFGGWVWTALTSMFMHGSSWHLLANMVSLFFIGLFVEQLIGKKRFLGFYFISGLFAAIFYVSLSILFGASDLGMKLFGSPNTLALGASGAIFGLLGLLAILTPKNRVYLIAGPLIAIIIQALLNIFIKDSKILGVFDLFVMIYFVFSIFAIFSMNPKTRKYALPLEMPFWVLPIIAIVPLVIIGLFVSLPIGNTAHLGGLLAGFAYGLYLKKRYPRKTRMIAKHFSK